MSLKFDLTTWSSLDRADELADDVAEHRLASEAIKRLTLLDRAWTRTLNSLADVDAELAAQFLAASEPHRIHIPKLVRALRHRRDACQWAVAEDRRLVNERVAATRARLAAKAEAEAAKAS